MRTKRLLLIAGIMAAGIAAQAQYSWDITPGTVGVGDSAITTGAGTWDTTTGNWTSDGGVNNTNWINGSSATFGSGGYKVTVADSGVTVGALTLGAGSGTVTMKAATDNVGAITVSGSQTWDLNGRQLSFVNDSNNDTKLNVASGQTLTVQSTGGGGTFDAGIKPNGSTWGVTGATLDFQASTLKGSLATIGQFATIKMGGGDTYSHERNAAQTYASNWELAAGTTTFETRNKQNLQLNGVISGAGRLEVKHTGVNGSGVYRSVKLRGANTFSGGVTVDGGSGSTADVAELNITSDGNLGDGPFAVDADNIILRNDGVLNLNGVITLDSNRGITLDNGGTVMVGGNSSYGGKITGTGGLQVGRQDSANGKVFTLTADTHDYTGGTTVFRGVLGIGVDNALPTDQVLTIGGAGAATTARVELNGNDLTIAGLNHGSDDGTRRLDNNGGGTTATLTINAATGQSYNYQSNFGGADLINIVKTGAGAQSFEKTDAMSNVGTVTVNGGLLSWNTEGGGAMSIGTGGTLGGTGVVSGVATIAGNLNPGNSPGTLTFLENLTLESTATTTLEIAGTGLGLFDVLANDGADTLTAAGILDFDTTGYSATYGDSFTVFDNWGSFAGSFSSITGTDLGGGLSFDTSNLLVDGSVSVIPEPATLGLLVAMGSGMLFIRRVFTM